MFSRFFVRRPVFARVIAILIMLAGVLAIRTLPVGQYPDVAPPAVKISATYTGASAETRGEQRHPGHRAAASPASTICSTSAPPAAPTARSASPSPLSRGPSPDTARCRCKTKCSRRNRGCRAKSSSPA